MTFIVDDSMAWTNERLKLSCTDSITFKNLWRMIVLDNNNNISNNNIFNEKDTEQLANYLANKEMPNNMSLLKFLAINALELSAPASPLLLQQNNSIPPGWLQLAGHPESIAPGANGIVRKRIPNSSDHEAIAYRGLTKDPYASKLIPKFYGIRELNDGNTYIELEDLLHGFNDPAVMDIKMGRRTFLESEVNNKSVRSDLYNKMLAINSSALTADEHQCKGITKLRYMLYREQISSSASKGFRIEALKTKGSAPVNDLQKVKSGNEVEATILNFLNNQKTTTKELIKRLRAMRLLIEKSSFFDSHEIVGSSVFIVYDNERVGAWLIDFAKTRALPIGIKVDHRKPWVPGNYEEGLLHGMDELIKVFEKCYASQTKYTSNNNNNSSTKPCSMR